ncbi:hypothetical protein KW076_01035 [Micrococcus porci]|uniref:hypothetical protein n=1 Tax=Micrococcus TaxID=1269 RepID=UPI001CCEFE31|nr:MULTISPECIES: hypothetical protein [Micrococcus]MCK6090204.1 hypothetical protein [Micrococcus endophyticus]UBH24816.1 hypothetical protein KW076_01035 [Micrococcus porci]
MYLPRVRAPHTKTLPTLALVASITAALATGCSANTSQDAPASSAPAPTATASASSLSPDEAARSLASLESEAAQAKVDAAQRNFDAAVASASARALEYSQSKAAGQDLGQVTLETLDIGDTRPEWARPIKDVKAVGTDGIYVTYSETLTTAQAVEVATSIARRLAMFSVDSLNRVTLSDASGTEHVVDITRG